MIGWIDSLEESDDLLEQSRPATTYPLPTPQRVHAAQHQHTPTSPPRRISQDGYVDSHTDEAEEKRKPETKFFGGLREPVKGRKWDHARESDPVFLRSSALSHASPWQRYLRASMYGRGPDQDGEVMDEGFLREQTPGYERPWRGDVVGDEDPGNLTNLLRNKKKRKTLARRIQVCPSL